MGQEGKPWAARFSSGGTYLFPRSSARWPVPPGSAALPGTPGGARCGAGTDLSQPTSASAANGQDSGPEFPCDNGPCYGFAVICPRVMRWKEAREGGAGHLYGALAGKD